MLKISDIQAYKTSSELDKLIWDVVEKWSLLGKKTIGEQWIRSTDSIAANIAEGEGRFFKKDKMKFFYQARGSLFESAHWTQKAYERKLINTDSYEKIMLLLRRLPREINSLISGTAKNLKR
jgi:four helix bundle protein